MRSRRTVFMLAAGLIVLLIPSLLLPTSRPKSAINQENFDRIQVGMTEDEVEAILGGPPGNYTDRRYPMSYTGGSLLYRSWIGDGGVISIGGSRDQDDPNAPWRVSCTYFTPHRPEPFVDRVLDLLPW